MGGRWAENARIPLKVLPRDRVLHNSIYKLGYESLANGLNDKTKSTFALEQTSANRNSDQVHVVGVHEPPRFSLPVIRTLVSKIIRRCQYCRY